MSESHSFVCLLFSIFLSHTTECDDDEVDAALLASFEAHVQALKGTPILVVCALANPNHLHSRVRKLIQ